MAFKSQRALVEIELILVRDYFQKLYSNDVGPGFVVPKFIHIKKATDLDDLNQLVYDFYCSAIDVFNITLDFKQKRALSQPIDAYQFIEQLEKLQLVMIARLNAILQTKDESLLSYFLGKNTGRQTLYYLVLINIYHLNQWNANLYLEGVLDLLMKTSSNPIEQSVIQYLKLLTSKSEEHLQQDLENNFWLNALMAHAAAISDEKITTIEALIGNYPVMSDSQVPPLVQSFLKHSFIQGCIFGVMRFEERNIAYLERIVLSLTKHHFLEGSKDTFSLFTAIVEYASSVNLFVDNHQLFNSNSQLLTTKHTQLLMVQLYLYDHFTPQNLSIEFAFSMADAVSHLLGAGIAKKHMLYQNIFWRAAAKVFLLPTVVDMNYLTYFSRNLHTFVEHFIQVHDLSTARQLVERLLNFAHASQKNILQDYKSQLVELLNLFKFLDMSDNEQDAASLWQSWLAEFNERKLEIRYLSPDYMNKNYPLGRTVLITKLLQKLRFFRGVLETERFNDDTYGLQRYAFHVAQLLEATSEQMDLLEKCFGHDKEIDFSFADEEPEEKENHQPACSKEKNRSLSISPQSMFKPLKQNIILAEQLPKVLLELAQHTHSHFKQQGILVLTGGSICTLKDGKPHLGDFDCILELDEDNQLEQILVKESISFKGLDSRKHNLLIQFLLFLKAHGYVNYAARPELSLIELSIDGVAIDIKLEHRQGLSTEQALIRDLAKRDFKLTTLFVYLQPGETEFEIRGFDKAVRSANKKLISVVGQNATVFSEDPVRLLRLIKCQLSHPDFSIDPQLSKIYRQTPWNECFAEAFKSSTHRGRFITQLQVLFSRFGFQLILEQLIKQKKIEAIFGIYNDAVKQTLPMLLDMIDMDSYTTRLNLFLFFYIHHAYQSHDVEQFMASSYYALLTSVPSCHRIYFEHVNAKCFDMPMYGIVMYQPLINMLKEIEQCYTKEVSAKITQGL